MRPISPTGPMLPMLPIPPRALRFPMEFDHAGRYRFGMQNDTPEWRVYHISPGRRIFGAFCYGPCIAGGLALAIFLPPADRAFGCGLGGFMALVGVGLYWLIDRTRLEISSAGVRLRQLGFTIETPWTNVEQIRIVRGQEAFVTAAPVEGKGAARLAAMGGSPIYDSTALALIAQRRLIPIEAFAWHLRREPFAGDLKRFAPHLEMAHEPPPPAKRKIDRRVLVAVGAVFIVFLVLAIFAPQWIGPALNICWAILMPFFALQSAMAGVRAFRSKARLMGILSLFMALMLALWSIELWSQVAKLHAPSRKPGGAPASKRSSG